MVQYRKCILLTILEHMSYRRRTASQCVFFLAVVAILPAGFFRIHTYLFLEPSALQQLAWSEDSSGNTTTTSAFTTDIFHNDHGTSKQQQQQQQTSSQTGALAQRTAAGGVPPQAATIQQDTTIIQHKKNASVSIPAARLNECLVEANRIHIHDVTDEHRSQGLPLFASIVQSPVRNDERRRRQQQQPKSNGDDDQDDNDDDDDTLYWTAHFTLVHLTWKRKHSAPRVRFPQWSYPPDQAGSANHWYCDGQEALVVNDGCPKGNSLHVRCPQKTATSTTTSNANNQVVTVITNITIYNYTYYVRDHVLCELHHAVKKPKSTAQVAAAVMAYKMNVRLALEWMEYHRLIGIDHFYIYILDADFNDDATTVPASSYSPWPELDHITYIPWNLNPQVQRSNVDLFLFQTAAQTNAILRARALGLQWVAMNDMDEYIVTRGNYTASSTTVVPTATAATTSPRQLPLQTLLAKYYEQNNVAAIQGETISFGKENGSNKTQLPWLLDYTWRNDRTFGKMRRTKCLVRPTHTEYYVIHWVSWPEPDHHKDLLIHKADPEHELWIHHYKKPQNGPFALDRKEAKILVPDTSLRDMYASVVRERVNDILSRIQQQS
jgi:Glycosyltransferase family 92